MRSRSRPARRGRRFRGRRHHLLAAGAALAILVSGCNIQIHSQPDPSIGDDTMLIAADKGTPMFERNFNPFLRNARTAATYIYEPLIMSNPLDGKLTPWLASDWNLPNPQTITMTIRDGVTWSDGEPMTVEDVRFTFDLIKKYPAMDMNGAWSRIDSIETQDNTITFHLKGADAPALSVLAKTLIVPEHIWSDVEHPDTWRNKHPVGTGPFTLGNFSPLRYTLDRNPDYWQAENVQVEHLVLPANAEELDLVTRGFDWAYSFITDVDDTWGAANEHNKHWFPPGGTISLLPNHDVEPFDDVNVRRGLSLALNKQKIADVATVGYMDAASQTGLLLPNQADLLPPDIPNQGVIEQDKDAAIKAFEKAGFSFENNTMYTPSGKEFSFAITTANGYTDWLRAVQEVRSELATIGIDVTIDAPQAAAYQNTLTKGDYEVAIGGMGGGNYYQAFNTMLSSDFYAPSGETAQNNRIRFRSDQVDQLLADYRSAVDEEKQQRILRQLEHQVYDKLPAIAMYYGGLWGLYNDGRFTGWPTADNPYAPLQTYGSVPLLVLTHLRPVEEGEQP
ncbi:MAG TPA: ABC transporter substrate-binding protein [Ruania sp.]|nr:ABC transporter substrate-binding protein [Ruania sp.]